MDLLLEHDFTFNPDGSGRVQLRWSAPAGPDPDQFLRSELQGAHGVDAWADVACRVDGDRLEFTATAWFADVKRLRFHCQGFHSNQLDFAVTPLDDGDVEVASVQQGQPMFGPVPAGADEATLRSAMAEERGKLTVARGFVEELFAGMRGVATLRLPGRLQDTDRGERIDDNAVRVEFAGQQLLDLLDRLLQDDAVMLDLLRAGDAAPQRAMALLGDSAPIRLRTVGGAAPQFDYAAEVASAREQWAELQATLPPAARPLQPGEPLANVRVLASKLVREADSSRGLNPMGQNYCGWSLTIAGDLPEPALGADEGALDSALTEGGKQLAPDDEWQRRISFPRLTDDGRTVYFDVDLPLPDGDGLQVLRGSITCRFARGEDELELGFPELAEGAEGSVLGARLQQCGMEDGRFACELQLQVARDRVRALSLHTGGEVFELESRGYSACNDECTLQYSVDVEPAADARLVLRLVSDLQQAQLPFELGAVDLLGRPR